MRTSIFALILTFLLTMTVGAQSDTILITWEPTLNTVSGSVTITGTVAIPNMQIYFIEAAPYDPANPATDSWTPAVLPQFSQVNNGTLGVWDTTKFTDGIYQLRLHVVDSAQNNLYYTLAPIAVNNGGATTNSEQVAVITVPEAVEQVAPTAESSSPTTSSTDEMIPSPEVENRLPVPLGGHVRHFDDSTQATMLGAGMTWVKWQVPYFEGTDLVVARDRINWSHEAGFKVLLSITGEKDALATGGDEYLDAYAAFLGDVAGLGTDAIEVWNEMNIDREWPTGKIDPYAYKTMLEKAYTEIKASNPDTLVITGALAPTGAEGAFGLGSVWNDDRYYQGMANAGVADFADCIGAHYNEGILPPTSQGGDPRGEYPTRYLPLMLERVAFPFRNLDIPMCMTEMGYLSPEGFGTLPESFNWAANTSVAEQAQWLAQAIQIVGNYERMPVILAIVWNIDFDNYEEDPQAGYAIIRPEGNCPACESIIALAQ